MSRRRVKLALSDYVNLTGFCRERLVKC